LTARRQKGEGGFYQRASDGRWVGVVDAGYTATGARRRPQVSARDRGEALKRFRKLKADLAASGGIPSRQLTVAAWLDTWLAEVAGPQVRPRTLGAYRSIVNLHLKPVIGRRRLSALEPRHVREVQTAARAAGLAPSHVLKVHGVLSKALEDAMREDQVARNVARSAGRPKAAPNLRPFLTVQEARAVLAACENTWEASRWGAALLLGLRQGEALGLTWDRVRLDTAAIDVAWQMQALSWRHRRGCRCRDGTRAEACDRRELDVPAGYATQPVSGRFALVPPKSSRSVRILPLPAHMVTLLGLHREHVRDVVWPGLVWDDGHGAPMPPDRDRARWYAALERAGVSRVPLHSARHTMATLLMELGEDPLVIQTLMGHSSVLTTQGYQHVRQPLERKALEGLSEFVVPTT
jgi:integrase